MHVCGGALTKPIIRPNVLAEMSLEPGGADDVAREVARGAGGKWLALEGSGGRGLGGGGGAEGGVMSSTCLRERWD
jgi:hypothetical protein